MAWKRLTFILIPHHRATIKQVSVRRSIFYALLAFLVFAVGVMVFYIMGFKGKAFYASRTQEMAVENAILEKHLAMYDSTLNVMDVRVAELDSLNKAILKESKISDRDLKSVNDSDGAANIAGWRLSTDRMLQLIDRLDRDSRTFDERFASLYDVCLRHSDYLKRIPSIRPADGPILKEFGRSVDELTGREKMHEGININNVVGTPVVATADGVVSMVKLNATDENGIYIIIDHGNGYETTYTHLTPQVLVREGDTVTRGQRIGSVGQTGITIVAVAPHILYKVRYRGSLVNPAKYFFAPDFSDRDNRETAPSQTASPRS